MFMERIEIPVIEATRPARPLALKLAAGLAFVLFAMALMPPYVAAIAIWFVVAAGAKFIARAAVTAWQTILHAGELVVGR
jgi:uncharacterized membrane protein YqjE